MDVKSIQGAQSLVAGLQVSARAKAQSPVPAPRAGDLLALGERIDRDYARTVLEDSLAERLGAAFEEAGVEIDVDELLESELDTSPEATAQRIVDFSTSFLEAFKSNNMSLGALEQLDGFVSLIKEAIEKGFEEAGQILGGIGQVPEEVQGGIDQTFDLVMKGIDEFAEKQRSALAEKQEEAGAL